MGRKSRNTRQKEIIGEEILAEKDFFSVEELYQRAQNRDKQIGVATVYRFLRAAKETGRIYAYECEGRTVFSTAKKDHCHFVCKKCGKTVHFNVSSIDFLKKKLEGEVTQFQILVEGFCRNCS